MAFSAHHPAPPWSRAGERYLRRSVTSRARGRQGSFGGAEKFAITRDGGRDREGEAPAEPGYPDRRTDPRQLAGRLALPFGDAVFARPFDASPALAGHPSPLYAVSRGAAGVSLLK